jgi:hypothetical protein
VEAAERVRRGLVDDDLARHTESRREIDCAAADLELLASRGGRLITPYDNEWPPLLAFAAFGAAELRPRGGPPMVLWALGPERLDEVAQRAAAVVGTRASTVYGEHVAAQNSQIRITVSSFKRWPLSPYSSVAWTSCHRGGVDGRQSDVSFLCTGGAASERAQGH